MTRAEFVDAALTYCDLTDASVSSWKRTVKHNTAVGGVVQSAHLFGLAVDVVYDAPVALPLAMERARRLGLRLLREADHDHLQPVDWTKS